MGLLLVIILGLIVVGGPLSVVAISNSRHARWAPFIGFVALFAGLGALALSLGLMLLLLALFDSLNAGILGFLGGYFVGGLGGAAFGLNRAFLRRRRIRAMADE